MFAKGAKSTMGDCLNRTRVAVLSNVGMATRALLSGVTTCGSKCHTVSDSAGFGLSRRTVRRFEGGLTSGCRSASRCANRVEDTLSRMSSVSSINVPSDGKMFSVRRRVSDSLVGLISGMGDCRERGIMQLRGSMRLLLRGLRSYLSGVNLDRNTVRDCRANDFVANGSTNALGANVGVFKSLRRGGGRTCSRVCRARRGVGSRTRGEGARKV